MNRLDIKLSYDERTNTFTIKKAGKIIFNGDQIECYEKLMKCITVAKSINTPTTSELVHTL